MTDSTISGLPAAGTLAGTEPLPIVQGGTTKKTTVADIASLATGLISSVTGTGSTSGLTLSSATSGGAAVLTLGGAITSGAVTAALGFTPGTGTITSVTGTGTAGGLTLSSATTGGAVTLTLSGSGYTLPAATSLALGGVKAGSNVMVATDGTLSLTSGNVTGALGYTPGTGSVTTVTGTGTASGLTLTSSTTGGAATLTLGGAVTSGAVTTALGYTPGTGTVTSVDASGGTTGLTFTGTPIVSSGTLTLGGTLAIGSGGTGQPTASDAANALLGGLSTTQGALAYRDAAAWAALGPGTAGQVLQTGGAGANPSWATVSGGALFAPVPQSGAYYSMPGSLTGGQTGAARIYLVPFVIIGTATLKTISVQIGAITNSGSIAAGVVADNNGQPGTAIVSQASMTAAANNTNTITLPSGGQSVSNRFWVVFCATANINITTFGAPAGGGLYGAGPIQPYLTGSASISNWFTQGPVVWTSTSTPAATIPTPLAGLSRSEIVFPVLVLGF